VDWTATNAGWKDGAGAGSAATTGAAVARAAEADAEAVLGERRCWLRRSEGGGAKVVEGLRGMGGAVLVALDQLLGLLLWKMSRHWMEAC
jgi:hypothetical protein